LALELAIAPAPSLAQGAAATPLQIHIDLVTGKSPKPTVRVELHNAGDHDLILNLGVMLYNGKLQRVDAIRLVFTDAHGKSMDLELMEAGIAAGRMDPLVVPLPVGASFSLPIDLAAYWAPKEKIFELNLAPGTYSLAARYTGSNIDFTLDVGGMALMPYWIGTVESKPVSFTVPRAHASP
jgi:hypothetical protein